MEHSLTVIKGGKSVAAQAPQALLIYLAEFFVKNGVAMTGEITLRGRILPIGGIKEKILAAKRAGIKKIILPKLNEKDLEEVPHNVKRGLELIFAEEMDEILDKFLAKRLKRKIRA